MVLGWVRMSHLLYRIISSFRCRWREDRRKRCKWGKCGKNLEINESCWRQRIEDRAAVAMTKPSQPSSLASIRTRLLAAVELITLAIWRKSLFLVTKSINIWDCSHQERWQYISLQVNSMCFMSKQIREQNNKTSIDKIQQSAKKQQKKRGTERKKPSALPKDTEKTEKFYICFWMWTHHFCT